MRPLGRGPRAIDSFDVLDENRNTIEAHQNFVQGFVLCFWNFATNVIQMNRSVAFR
jgi:hypothetical protein